MNWLRETFPGIARIVSLPTLLLYLLSLSVGLTVIVTTPLGQMLASSSSQQHIGFFFVPFLIPLTINRLIPTSIALAAYFACFAMAFTRAGSYLNGLGNRTYATRRRIPNWLVVLPILSSTLLVIVIFLAWIEDRIGFPTGGLPSASVPELFASLTTAPFSEEWTYRITTLGLLVVFRSLFSPSTTPGRTSRKLILVYSLLEPDTAKEKAGLLSVAGHGRRGIHLAEWILLGFSSMIFGLAHFTIGSTWGAGKVATAALSGFVIGLSYLVYGVYASILLHWFFDYYLQVYPLLAISSLSDQTFERTINLLNFVNYSWTIFLGILGLVVLVFFVSSHRGRGSCAAL